MTDANLYRRKVGNARRYFDPLPACPLNPHPDPSQNLVNVTGLTGAWQGEFRKTVHGQNGPLDAHRAAAWTVAHVDKVAEVAAVDPTDAHRAIVRAAVADLTDAARRGSAVHELVEELVTGQPRLVIDPVDVAHRDRYRSTVEQLLTWLAPLDVVAVEVAMFDPDRGYAGTADLIVRSDRLGGTFLVDHKTRGADSRHGCWEKEVAQLGLLAACRYMIVDGPHGPERQPLPALDGCAVFSIRPDGFAIYPVDVDGAVTAGNLCLATWEARQEGQRAARRAVGDVHLDNRTHVAQRAEQLAARCDDFVAAHGVQQLAALWAAHLADVHGPKRWAEWPLDHVERVEAALDAPFGDPPAPAPAPVVDNYQPPARPPVEDHGGAAPDHEVRQLVERLNRAPVAVRDWNLLWRAEGEAAGHAWRMGRGSAVSWRSYWTSLAGLWLARIVDQADSTDAGIGDVRTVLRSVLGDERAAQPVGATLGALTLDEAQQVQSLAQAAWEGQVRVLDDGRMEVAA